MYDRVRVTLLRPKTQSKIALQSGRVNAPLALVQDCQFNFERYQGILSCLSTLPINIFRPQTAKRLSKTGLHTAPQHLLEQHYSD
jgi:hypothetical protein